MHEQQCTLSNASQPALLVHLLEIQSQLCNVRLTLGKELGKMGVLPNEELVLFVEQSRRPQLLLGLLGLALQGPSLLAMR